MGNGNLRVVGNKPGKHDDTLVVEEMEVTPELAWKWLKATSEAGFLNRLVNERRVVLYINEMRSNLWQLNGETIKLTADDVVIDGQHRLVACHRGNVSFRTLVVMGADEASFGTIDKGQPKSFAVELAHRGETNQRALGAAIVWYIDIVRMIEKKGEARGDTSLTEREKLACLAAHPLLRDSVAWAKTKQLQRLTKLPSALAAIRTLLIEQSGTTAAAFFDRLRNGDVRGREDPVFVLRSALERTRGDATRTKQYGVWMTACTVHAWNVEAEGRVIQMLKWSPKYAFPKPRVL